jgi:hypothetical protein
MKIWNNEVHKIAKTEIWKYEHSTTVAIKGKLKRGDELFVEPDLSVTLKKWQT